MRLVALLPFQSRAHPPSEKIWCRCLGLQCDWQCCGMSACGAGLRALFRLVLAPKLTQTGFAPRVSRCVSRMSWQRSGEMCWNTIYWLQWWDLEPKCVNVFNVPVRCIILDLCLYKCIKIESLSWNTCCPPFTCHTHSKVNWTLIAPVFIPLDTTCQERLPCQRRLRSQSKTRTPLYWGWGGWANATQKYSFPWSPTMT